MDKRVMVAGLLGALGIGLGAFGAHGLKPLLAAADLANYKTAVFYHLVHSVVLLSVALYLSEKQNRRLNMAFWFFAVGIVFFSGSLYLLSTHEVTGMTRWKWLGPVTPLGGLSFIVGWLLIAFSARSRQNQ